MYNSYNAYKAASLFACVLALFAQTAAHGQPTSTAVEKANDLIAAGNNDAAATLLKSSIATARGDEEFLVRYEWALVDSDPVNARGELTAVAARSSSRRAATNLALGELLLLQGDPVAALNALDAAAHAREGAVSERAAYLRGAAFFTAGKYPEAREAYSDYLVEYLEGAYQPFARVGIALSNEKLNANRSAIEIYKAVLTQQKGFADEAWVLQRLVELLKADMPTESARYLARLNEEYPEQEGFAAGWEGSSVGFQVSPAREQDHAENMDHPEIVLQQNADRSDDAELPPATATAVIVAREPRPRSATVAPRLPQAVVVRRAPFTVQAAAFGDRLSAQRLLSKFVARGFVGEIAQKGQLHRLYIGRYRSRGEAMAAVDKIERIAGQKVMVVEIVEK